MRVTTQTRPGIALGDVIIGIADKRVETFDDLYTILDAHKPDDVVKVTVARGGTTATMQVKVIVLNPTTSN
jgi:S1-C subfamily serine protease